MRVAAVQPALELGEVQKNLARLEQLIRDAHREHNPEVIVVPEACSTPNVYAKALRSTPMPVDGQPLALLTGLACSLQCVLAGGFVAVRGSDAYGTFVLAEPDGAVHLHDKDIPTAWEQNFYRGGDDAGTPHCRALNCTVGLMSGWEWARYGTARRVRQAGARVVLGGMCWPSMPTNWPGPLGRLCEHEHARWRAQAKALPGQVARLTGVPAVHASHVGPVVGETPLAPFLAWPTVMIGETQICDRDGTILARLSLEDGEGHVAADVDVDAAPSPRAELRDRFWIPDMSMLTLAAWHGMNAHGALSYRLRHAGRGFPWQRWPGGDLPDEIPGGEQAPAPLAGSG
jgi:predicted amidohydrolase